MAEVQVYEGEGTKHCYDPLPEGLMDWTRKIHTQRWTVRSYGSKIAGDIELAYIRGLDEDTLKKIAELIIVLRKLEEYGIASGPLLSLTVDADNTSGPLRQVVEIRHISESWERIPKQYGGYEKIRVLAITWERVYDNA